MKTVRVVGLGGSAAILVIAIYAGYAATKVDADESVRQRQEGAFHQGGFRAAAAVTGTYVRNEEPGEASGPLSPVQLVSAADAVVVGTVISNRGVMSSSGEGLRTHYRIRVTQVLKGRVLIPEFPEVVLSVLGGRASLGSGSWAQLNVRYADPPLNGESFLLFMRRIPADATFGPHSVEAPGADFWPVHGSSGIVGLGLDGSGIRPSDRRAGAARGIARYGGRSSELIREIAALCRN